MFNFFQFSKRVSNKVEMVDKANVRQVKHIQNDFSTSTSLNPPQPPNFNFNTQTSFDQNPNRPERAQFIKPTEEKRCEENSFSSSDDSASNSVEAQDGSIFEHPKSPVKVYDIKKIDPEAGNYNFWGVPPKFRDCGPSHRVSVDCPYSVSTSFHSACSNLSSEQNSDIANLRDFDGLEGHLHFPDFINQVPQIR